MMFQLSPSQIDEYLENGILVVDNVFSESEVNQAKKGCLASLHARGVHSFDVEDDASARAFDKLSSTNGSGGVLDIFYDDWKLHGVATHAKLFSMTTQLWKAAYNRGSHQDNKESISKEHRFQWHPYGGDIDFSKGYVYIDRLGYRLPSTLSQSWGDRIHSGQKKKKLRSVQRSLTPHLDCCPENLFKQTSKWRPIQCFVSLTDNLEPNTGGFEAAPGFHKNFDEWARQRRQHAGENGNYDSAVSNRTSLCVGEYTHIRPKEDAEVMAQIKHIPVKAGSAVFWDNRIPHANAYRNDSDDARVVVYCSFLPDIGLNRCYVQNQLRAWKLRQPIRDQWNEMELERVETSVEALASVDENKFNDLGKRLMGIKSW
jgi:hypothetical protein